MATKKKVQPLENRTESFFSSIMDDIPSDRLDSLIVIGIKTRGEYLGKRLVERISERTGKDVTFGTIDITLYRDDLRTGRIGHGCAEPASLTTYRGRI